MLAAVGPQILEVTDSKKGTSMTKQMAKHHKKAAKHGRAAQHTKRARGKKRDPAKKPITREKQVNGIAGFE